MSALEYISGHIPPKAKSVGHAVIAGAVIGAATGGLAEMARGFNAQSPPRRPFVENVQRQRQHKNHHYRSY